MDLILSKTPYRISFFGGATDYPKWYREHGGAVLSTSIDKYCYIFCRYHTPFSSESRHRVVWSHIENVSTIAEILHPAVREALRWLGFDDERGVEIHHQADLRARAGIGSSSSFAVGLISALSALRGERLEQRELALRAIELEQDVLGDKVGSQDQVAAAHGGLNVIRFHRSGEIDVEPVDISEARRRELASRLLLVYTGSSRLSSRIAASVLSNMSQRKPVLTRLHAMVEEGRKLLVDGDLDEFGHLLNESWMLKRELGAGVSNAEIDSIYESAVKNGALGGKLLGAGGTGFMVFYVPYGERKRVEAALDRFSQVPIGFETDGTRLLLAPQS
jgi:D-glycero-alpha-D-manno-heptose-7-phosphate kinase